MNRLSLLPWKTIDLDSLSVSLAPHSLKGCVTPRDRMAQFSAPSSPCASLLLFSRKRGFLLSLGTFPSRPTSGKWGRERG